MPADNRRDFENRLKNANISQKEIPKIVNNLQKLVDSKVSRSDIDQIIQNIISKSDFRASFIKDYKSAVKKVGINPVPSP
jgi:hypothetical protein